MSVNKSNVILAVVLSLSLFGVYKSTDPVSANGSITKTMRIKQAKNQKKPQLIKKVNKQSKSTKLSSKKVPHYNHPTFKDDWFRDGLSKKQYNARKWVSWHESRFHWNVLSYGHRCIGAFQLDPAYLGKKNGHVNLNHVHQVQVADHYAKNRYGSWVHAKHFWQTHNWY